MKEMGYTSEKIRSRNPLKDKAGPYAEEYNQYMEEWLAKNMPEDKTQSNVPETAPVSNQTAEIPESPAPVAENPGPSAPVNETVKDQKVVRDIGSALQDTYEAIQEAKKAHNEAIKYYRMALAEPSAKRARNLLIMVKDLLEEKFDAVFTEITNDFDVSSLPKYEPQKNPTVTRKNAPNAQPGAPVPIEEPTLQNTQSPAPVEQPSWVAHAPQTSSRPKIIRVSSKTPEAPKIRLGT